MVRLVVVAALAMIVAACGGPAQPSPPAAIVSGVPAAIGDGWSLSTLGDEGFDAARVEALAARIQGGRYGLVDGLVIARNGRLCFDAYFNGSPTSVHELQSVTKCVAEAWGARAQHIFVVRPMKRLVVVIARDERTDGGRQILDEILASVTTGR